MKHGTVNEEIEFLYHINVDVGNQSYELPIEDDIIQSGIENKQADLIEHNI